MNRFVFSLSKKALLAVLVILLPILITFIYGYFSTRDRLKTHILEDLTVIADSYEGQVFQFLEQIRRRTQDFASDGHIKLELERTKGPSASLSDYLRRNKLPLDQYINAIVITDPTGRVLASTDESKLAADLSSEPFFINALRGVEITENRFNSAPGLAISTTVTGFDSEKLEGYMTMFLHLSELDNMLTGQFAKDLGAISWDRNTRKTLEVYLVNTEGYMITSSRFIEGAILRQKVATPPVKGCLEAKREMAGFYWDYRGISVAGASMCISSPGWTLIVEVDEDEVMTPVRKIREQALIAAGIVAGLIALLYYIFHRTVAAQLQRLSSAFSTLERGQYSTNVPVSTNDEIGLLSRAFNNMAYALDARTQELKESELKYRSLVSNIPDVVWTADDEGRTIFITRNVGEVCGYTPEEVYAGPSFCSGRVHPEDAGAVKKRYRALFTEGRPYDIEYRFQRKDGEWIWLHDRAENVYLKDGVRYADGSFSDITERKKAEGALKESEEMLNRAQHIARLGGWDWDINNNVLLWSDEIYRIFGLKPQEFGATYESFLKSVHPDDRDLVKHSVYEALWNKKPYSIEHRIVLPDGTIRIVNEQADVTFDAGGRPVRMIGTVQDITERKEAEFELKKLSMAIEHSVNILFITDVNGNIEYVNPLFEQTTGYSKEEAIGQTPRILASGEVPNSIYEELWRTVLSGKTWRSIIKNKKKTGGFYWCNAIISPIKNDRGEITNFLAVQEDITDRMISEERLKYLAHYDELTGLTNRSRFIDLLEEWITLASARGEIGMVYLIDMDDFKSLNDAYGHGVGDEFLRRAANLLKATMERIYEDKFKKKTGERPLLAHLSGDEFAVFVPSAGEADGLAVAESLRSAVEGFRFAEVQAALTVSIGAAIYPVHGANFRELFTRADAALYRAKELGRNRTHLYHPEDQDLEKMHSRLAWREKIQKALKDGRFDPWFQPLLDLKDNSVSHYEVLARMRDEDGKILLPGAFIGIAERFGLVGSIDRMIMEKAMRLQAEMRLKGHSITFGMNLSGKDLGEEGILDFIKSKIIETGADPNRLVFEITETAAIGDLERAKKFVKALKGLGCHFALDDFGVGFTSFTYLKEMQVDFIKIDGSFIKKLHENPDDQVFVKAITDVARGLKIRSIAEFVETKETLRLLSRYGVDFAQGYLIGKPAQVLKHPYQLEFETGKTTAAHQ